jgi:Rrf2 family protein
MLSQKAKYGIHALMHLARRGQGTPVLIRDIATQEKLPRKFLEAILLELKSTGMLQARPGKGGGYMLQRPPHAITLGQVVRLIDGPLAPIPCVSQTAYAPCRDCRDERICALRDAMKRVRDSTAEILDRITLADLVDRERQLAGLLAPLDFSI